MKFIELEQEVAKYMYTEDSGMIRVALASIIATRMRLGNPIWFTLIGPSSSGKSQVLRPLAMTDEKFIHRVDDLTENTLLSGIKVGAGKKDISLLKRIGKLGIIVISDFTVIFSKGAESRNAILGQLRMVYDGEMIKYSGVNPEPITWKGKLGLIAGATPSIYGYFEEVADMGERFIYFRMKDYDMEKATRIALNRTIYGEELDQKLSDIYSEYIKEAVQDVVDEVPQVSEIIRERIIKMTMFAADLRTPTHYDKFARVVDKIPVTEGPMRIALQLEALARGIMVMHHKDTGSWELEEQDISYLEWCAYSLANEERRACLKVLASLEWAEYISTQAIADIVGLSTPVIGMVMQHLGAINVVERTGTNDGLMWRIKKAETYRTIRRVNGIDENIIINERGITLEDGEQVENNNLDKF